MTQSKARTAQTSIYSTVYGGLLLAGFIAIVGVFVVAEADDAGWSTFGWLLISAAVLGVFIMVGAAAVIGAIHGSRDQS